MKLFILYITLLLSAALLNAQTFDAILRQVERLPEASRAPVLDEYFRSKGFFPIVENDTVLHFVHYGTAHNVLVNGNLQHWDTPVQMERIPCGAYSLFYKTFTVPSNARLDYKLIIDGVSSIDPLNPYTTPSGYGPHSEVRMPRFVSSPYLIYRADIRHGTLDTLHTYGNVLPALRRYLPFTRPVIVYTPAGYDTAANLPSVYVQDGFEAIDFAMVPKILDNLIAEGRIPPVVAVFIPPAARYEEYLGSQREQYVRQLADDLVPLIDRNYKTSRAPEKRAVMGISAGATISIAAVLRRPEVFRNAAGQSTTITPWLMDLTRERFGSDTAMPPLKIYFDCGRYDIMDVSTVFGTTDFLTLNSMYSNLLSSYRVPHYFKVVNDGHEWASWRERMPEVFTYFFGIYR
ncbi:MAG: alpha/beta hydrolase-fold protein [Bacteroidota bacterium]